MMNKVREVVRRLRVFKRLRVMEAVLNTSWPCARCGCLTVQELLERLFNPSGLRIRACVWCATVLRAQGYTKNPPRQQEAAQEAAVQNKVQK